jgi:hypothetical protein
MTKGTRRRLRRRAWHGDLLAVLGALLAGAAFLTVQQLASDLRAANEARDALATQVQRLGATPVAGPPGSRGKEGRSVTGARGPKGDPGDPGPPGEPGPSGSPGPSGPPGKNGAAGQSGTDGVGQAGATGPAGPAGPPGPQGEPGPAGKDGQNGAAGTDGQTCPAGYSLQAPAYDTDALVCRRDPAPSDDGPSKTSPLSLGLDPTRRQYA